MGDMELEDLFEAVGALAIRVDTACMATDYKVEVKRTNMALVKMQQLLLALGKRYFSLKEQVDSDNMTAIKQDLAAAQQNLKRLEEENAKLVTELAAAQAANEKKIEEEVAKVDTKLKDLKDAVPTKEEVAMKADVATLQTEVKAVQEQQTKDTKTVESVEKKTNEWLTVGSKLTNQVARMAGQQQKNNLRVEKMPGDGTAIELTNKLLFSTDGLGLTKEQVKVEAAFFLQTSAEAARNGRGKTIIVKLRGESDKAVVFGNVKNLKDKPLNCVTIDDDLPLEERKMRDVLLKRRQGMVKEGGRFQKKDVRVVNVSMKPVLVARKTAEGGGDTWVQYTPDKKGDKEWDAQKADTYEWKEGPAPKRAIPRSAR